ncbi:hypothetical protein [Nostoc sp. FACHB-110]|uniref:hypothetical protein n=1 Tax=Nostoc sp. FACHB-110 TaxID=2692834 RepID=UPI001685619D|nr:hypothetical protein [Nostoc sp. FACHB-110]MBD2438302.1 hypothetical protein [Nostoc sp. FACHB-110]
MRKNGEKSIINSKKNALNSCPRPTASLHFTVIDALKIPATKESSILSNSIQELGVRIQNI